MQIESCVVVFKMELYLMTRGKSDVVEEWAKWMSTRHLPMKVKHANGTEEQLMMECQLRPIQLWSFVFPKENLDIVLNTLKLPQEKSPFGNADGSKVVYNIMPKIWALRKLLGAKEIPKPNPEAGMMFLPFDRLKHMNILGIGIREDGDIAEAIHERI